MAMVRNATAVLALLAVVVTLPLAGGEARAQSLTLPGEIPSASESGGDGSGEGSSGRGDRSGGGEAVDAAPRSNWDSSRYGRPGGAREEWAPDEFPPFGAHLFKGGFQGTRADGLNPDYEVKPGDEVVLRVWGAVEVDRVIPVDAQGNVFIPSIGPVKVLGLNAQQLDNRIRGAIREVYPNDVEVYTNLQGVQPVGVFVTGYVDSPGRYAGTPDDSLLYFLSQAQGIDPELGSYRRIRVIRDGETIARADLYDFLLDGELPATQFHDGDTIVVEERGPTVFVGGDVRRPYRYELRDDERSGQRVLEYARKESGISHVFLAGSREQGPIARYLPLAEFRDQPVKDGDEIRLAADQRDNSIVVEIEGSYHGPSRYVLPKDARLGEFLDAVAVPRSRTAVRNVSIKRESVAQRQKEALEESLRRLETTYLSASSSTNEEAAIRTQEAELIQDFVKRAGEMEPSGRLVVAHQDGVRDIRLQDGDVVTIPEDSDSILVSGEVQVPQAVVYTEGRSAWDYIEGAGGFTDRANDERILIVRQNGAVRDASDVEMRSGDEILVLPEVPTKNLQLAKSLSQILYNIAITTRVALDI